MPAARKRPRSNTPKVHNKTVWLDLGYLGTNFHVGFVPSAKAWATITRRLRIGDTYPTTAANCMHYALGGVHTVLITVAEKQDTSNGINVSSLILHEAVHVWQFLCDKIGEEKPSVEFEAYTIQNIYGDLAEAYCNSRRELFKQPFRSK